MAQQIVLPKLGLTMQEGVIGEWLAEPGQRIGLGDVLLRLETDKVEVDVEAEAEGILATTAKAGDVLPVGAVIGWLLGEGEQAPNGVDAPVSVDAVLDDVASAAAPTAAPVSGDGTRLKSSPNARRVAAASNVDLAAIRGTGPGGRIVSEDVEEFLAATPAPAMAAEVEKPSESAGQFVGPLVRRRATELGVDLTRLVGTGIGGRVTKADVENAATPQAGSTAPTPTPARVTGPQPGDVIPLSGMRGAIARNMVDSLHTMAQLTHGYEVDVTALVAVRAQLKGEGSASKPPSLNDFVVKAAALALQQHPLLNAGIADDKVTLFEEINIGVAVAVDGGLVVPVVRDADALSLTAIATRTNAVATAARTGKLALNDMEGATFSVSTLGAYGVDFFTPVVNPGNVAILGVGRVKDGFRWEGDTPVKTQVMTLSLTFDHRAVDGAPAAEYLRTLGEILARPLSLLAG
ncbi:dihydrolipoamide acetyltransferase [Rhodococcus sp. Leaf7]|uniref:dihydrolipoamide acetyltransferase family protein n=1 Tax=unclassified Rhodococcus (in: high G+C Gram-positive bacteria) TaxID=192944 RepID=UPI0006FA044C|nr:MULTISPECIES: dihydrolipoamide acetyltransferase family protein [unclassified Rhodococcus (in: high G+C Gram-positive bacteria)]KQU07179.1 dihydrolipoamide acetyltransferase [Rhodococcus sp. Leaf7]KQU42697.1 dihydrolipoamide acetyltransferase [Rhodococcus sp. Leaf247]